MTMQPAMTMSPGLRTFALAVQVAGDTVARPWAHQGAA
jgi:hypothetical protein